MVVFVLAIVLVLCRAQRWLSRSTHRVFNTGMLAATVALVVSAAWLIGSFAVARADLQRAAGCARGLSRRLAEYR